MVATIARDYRFCAAHRLPNHEGKCRRQHGHEYVVTIEVTGPVSGEAGEPDEGMVVDYARLDAAWETLAGELDHQDLNLTIGPRIGVTTAENIAGYLLGQLPFASAVTVRETSKSSATVRRGDA